MICPLLPPDGDEKQDCMKCQCAWFDDIENQCCMMTIADSISNIEKHFNPPNQE